MYVLFKLISFLNFIFAVLFWKFAVFMFYLVQKCWSTCWSQVSFSVVVLEESPCPRGSSRTILQDLVLGPQVLTWGPRTMTCKMVLEDPWGQGLSSRTTTLNDSWDVSRQWPISLDRSCVAIPLERSYAVRSRVFLREQKYYLITNSNFWQNIGEEKCTIYSTFLTIQAIKLSRQISKHNVRYDVI